MSSINTTTTYYDEDYDQYYDVTIVDTTYTILRTHQHGYVYILSYDRLHRKYTIIDTNNMNLKATQ